MLTDRMPSLSSIRAFEAAARHKSFARAARELGTSGASVSYHVRQLEQQIGVILFRRYPHRVDLTPPGAQLARETIQAFAALRASFAKAAEADEARLSLTALPTFGTSWLTPRLGKFRALQAGIQIDLDLSPDPQDLAGGHFDAAIRNGHGRWPALRATRLFPSIFMPMCAPALRAAAAGLADSRRPLDVPLLGRQDWWALWYRALGAEGAVPPERFGINLATEHLDAAAAVAGHGITIGSPILFRSELDAGRLVVAHDQVVGDGRAFWLAYPVVQARRRKIAAFHRWLVEEAEEACAAARPFIDRAVVVVPT
jgi:LysR family glycine cleavage system transcriptional activator